jgi:hypothetical protein
VLQPGESTVETVGWGALVEEVADSDEVVEVEESEDVAESEELAELVTVDDADVELEVIGADELELMVDERVLVGTEEDGFGVGVGVVGHLALASFAQWLRPTPAISLPSL